MDEITVLGSSGMLGQAVSLLFPESYKPSRKEFDALKDDPRFSGWVINCIGAIPQRVKDSDTMWKLNAEFPLKIKGAKVIQIATDCIFSGKKGNYLETDLPDPVDEYGRSKLAGEAAKSFKIRCSIIGPDKSNASLFEWVRQQPAEATIYGYVDHLWNGVTTQTFARLARALVDNNYWKSGTFHFLPQNSVSKFELVKLIAKKTNRNDLKIVEKKTGNPINRTLSTVNPDLNKKMWNLAGYSQAPTIEQLIEEIPL